MNSRALTTTALLLMLTAGLSSCAGEASAPSESDLVPGTWIEVRPEGETGCANGSDYAFFARAGTVDRVIVAFMGGGACWNAETCGRPFAEGGGTAYYQDRVDLTAALVSNPAFAVGLHDTSNPQNPFSDWHQVFVPYCTGDLHLGNATVDYGDGVRVQHRGSANARAALDWTRDHFESPTNVFVTGCSAGAYASIFWTPYLRSLYPHADMAQLGDSGAGVITPSFAEEGLARWNVGDSLRHFVPGMSEADLRRADALERLYRSVAEAHPEVRLSQYNTLLDGVQVFFYAEMLGEPATPERAAEWSAEMLRSLDSLEADVGSFHSYVADYGFDEAQGTPHCIVTRDDLYTVAEGGTPFLAWLRALVSGEDPGRVRPLP